MGDHRSALFDADPPTDGAWGTLRRTHVRLEHFYNALTFHDLILFATQAVRESSELVADTLYIIDEFQDFNLAEDGLIREITTESPAQLLVGDDDQVLYDQLKHAHPSILRGYYASSTASGRVSNSRHVGRGKPERRKTMARPPTGQVLERAGKRGRTYALRYRVPGHGRVYETLGEAPEWDRSKNSFQKEPGPLDGDGMRMLAVDEKRVRELVEHFYRAFLAADREVLAKVVAPEAAWIVRLDTALSGAHVGPDGIAALRRQIDDLTAGTWRPLREDSFDIAASPWHAVIMDRFLAERGERRLDSHEAVIVAVEEGRVTRLFHYLHDPAAFAAFWTP